MKMIDKGIVAPKGFKATGIFAGIKKVKKDLAIIYSETPCTYAGAFTQNSVKAAPVLWDEHILKQGKNVHAVVINSGNANAVTGKKGIEDNEKMASVAAQALTIEKEEVLVCSTGVIGVNLPMNVIESGIVKAVTQLDDTKEAAYEAATAILTTDTFVKDIAIEGEIDNTVFHVGAIGKGSGMIHPNMATMLAFITTDLAISKEMLQKAVSKSVNKTFNMITVDGDTSTNDSVIVLANGQAGNKEIVSEGKAFDLFCEHLNEALKYVAISIVKDGEGATKLLEMTVQRVSSFERGKQLAKSILTSSLVKTAFFGEDANWGRILAAMGSTNERFEQEQITLTLESDGGCITLFKEGVPIVFSEKKAKKVLEENEIRIVIDMAEGNECVTAWGCDLSYDYVKINGEYRS